MLQRLNEQSEWWTLKLTKNPKTTKDSCDATNPGRLRDIFVTTMAGWGKYLSRVCWSESDDVCSRRLCFFCLNNLNNLPLRFVSLECAHPQQILTPLQVSVNFLWHFVPTSYLRRDFSCEWSEQVEPLLSQTYVCVCVFVCVVFYNCQRENKMVEFLERKTSFMWLIESLHCK